MGELDTVDGEEIREKPSWYGDFFSFAVDMSNEKNAWLLMFFFNGDYTTQLCGDYSKPAMLATHWILLMVQKSGNNQLIW